jgi:hypothetical protein
MTHEVVGSCQGETRMPEHTGLSPAEEGWTVANDNETCLVVALNCNVLQQTIAQFSRAFDASFNGDISLNPLTAVGITDVLSKHVASGRSHCSCQLQMPVPPNNRCFHPPAGALHWHGLLVQPLGLLSFLALVWLDAWYHPRL